MSSLLEIQYGITPYDPAFDFVLKEGLRGTSRSEFLQDEPDNNVIEGFGGNDVLHVDAGNDVVRGGGGQDLVSFVHPYSAQPAIRQRKGVFVNLKRGVATDFYGGKNRLHSIEDVEGTLSRDEIIGSKSANVLAGSDGDDKILGLDGDDLLYGGAGKDFLVGGRGSDRFFYASPTQGKDRIEGFTSGVDEFLINGREFLLDSYPVGYPTGYPIEAIGTLSEERFFLGSSARKDGQLFGYDPTNSTIIFDSNGKNRGGVHVLATLQGGSSSLEASDIRVV